MSRKDFGWGRFRSFNQDFEGAKLKDIPFMKFGSTDVLALKLSAVGTF